MAKKTSDLSHLLGSAQRKKLTRAFAQKIGDIQKKSEQLHAFCSKWNEIVKPVISGQKSYEKRLYQKFLQELLNSLGFSEFSGTGKANYDFERAYKRRPHDCVIGEIYLENEDSKFVTSIEVKSPNWNLDIDRNEKKETILEQAINVSQGNPFSRQIITTNFCTFRFYTPASGFEYFEQFHLIDLMNSEELREYFIVLMLPELLADYQLNESRIEFTNLVDESRGERKRKLDFVYDVYVESLNAVDNDLRTLHSSLDKLECRQLATQYINRYLFTEYTYQIGLHGISLQEMLSQSFSTSKLKELFLAMDKGGGFGGKHLPKFNGGLFCKNKTLDELKIGKNSQKFLQNLVNIQISDLAPEVLGRIFERSLSESLSELPNSPTESESLGAVYTPSFLAGAMAKFCFSLTGNHPKILDPACGSGVFLLETLKLHLSQVKNRSSKQIESILNSKITGWDINPAAVELTRFMLWQHVADLDLPLPTIENNVHTGDALLGNLEKSSKRPDIIIGNPPFIAHQNLRREYKDSLEERYKKTLDPKEQYDICIAFFEKALKTVSADGVVALVAPNQLSFRPYAKKLREHILKNHEIERIVDLTRVEIFDRAICPFVYVLRKGRGKRKPKSFFVYTDITTQNEVCDAFEIRPNFTSFIQMSHKKDLKFLAAGLVNTGVKVIDSWDFDIFSRQVDSSTIRTLLKENISRGKVKKSLTGTKTVEVATSKLDDKGKPLIKSFQVTTTEYERVVDKYDTDKIAIPRFFQSQIATVSLDSSVMVGENVYYLTPNDLNNAEDLQFLNAILNSRIYSLLDYSASGLDRINSRGFRAMDGEKFSNLMLPYITEDQKEEIVRLYRDADSHMHLLDDEEELDALSRVKRTRVNRAISFEQAICNVFNLALSKLELKKALKWWAEKRKTFLDDSSELDEAA